MKKHFPTFLIAFLPIVFGVFGVGHFYLGKKQEGFIFFVLGIVNMLGIFFYMPFEAESLLGSNISAYYGGAKGLDIVAPIVTIAAWSGLFASSIFRIGTFVSSK